MSVRNLATLSVSPLLGLLLLLTATPAASGSDITAHPFKICRCGKFADAAHYSVEIAHIPAKGASCIPGFLYIPTKPLTQPPGLVVMLPALGQNALQQGLHSYAHAFANNGLAVLLLSAPGSLVTSSVDPKARRFLLHCGKEQQQQQQQADIPASLFGSTFRAVVNGYVQLLAHQGRADAGRVAYWGAEWGAVAAVQVAVEQQQGSVQAVILQTPWLGGTRAQAWQRLASQGWLPAAKALGLALCDSLAALLHLPPWLRATAPLSGLPGSATLLQLQQHELHAHQAALAPQEAVAEDHKIGAAVLLEMLIWGNPISQLLPKLQIPVGYYAAAADSDTPVELYVANSKRAKYVGFHVSSGSRYSLLAGGASAVAGREVLLDQTLLLVALLGDVDLGPIPESNAAVPAGLAAGHNSEGKQQQQQQQQQQASAGEDGEVAAGRLFPFQQPGGVHGLDHHCLAAGHGMEQQQHVSALQACK